MHEWEGEGGRVGGSWVRQVTTPVSRSIITASSTLCVRWEGVDGEVRVCEGVREAYILKLWGVSDGGVTTKKNGSRCIQALQELLR